MFNYLKIFLKIRKLETRIEHDISLFKFSCNVREAMRKGERWGHKFAPLCTDPREKK